MRVLHRHRDWLLACCLLLLCLIWIHRVSNVFDLFFHLISSGKNELLLSLHCNSGRLGNQMCTYATLYGLSTLNGRRFVPLTCNKKRLEEIFVGPSRVQSIHRYLYLKVHPWKLSSYFKPEDAAIPINSNFMDGYLYPCSYTFFDHARDQIRREFQFHKHLKLHAQDLLHQANVHHLPNATYVGIHVRRGDYQRKWIEAFEGVPVNMEYFQKALKYFRDKYRNIVFIAVSDDRLWCIKKLSVDFGVYVPKEAPSPAHDLAVLANCNHTILTYGTFGFWGAYLAGGEVLYFDKFLKPNTTFTLNNFLFEKMYPSDWKGIVTVNSSYWLEKIKTTPYTNKSLTTKRVDKKTFV